MLMRGPADGERIYLTFDDGPDPGCTPRILDILAQARVRATFFVIGRQARAHASLVRRIAELGHEIGNHTASHRHPWTLPAATARREVRDGASAIADITGTRPAYFRPPHGRLRRCMMEEATLGGQATVLWSVSAIDWGPLGRADRILARLKKSVPGDIVLMHDGGRRPNKPGELAAVLPDFLAAIGHWRLTPAFLRDAVQPVRI